MRRIGQTIAFCIQMKREFESGVNFCFVVGKERPQKYVNILKDWGLELEIEEVYSEGLGMPLGTQREKKLVGYKLIKV